MHKAIIVSGTPGTGKTTVAKILAGLIDSEYVDVSSLIKNNSLNEDYDEERKCIIVDEEKLESLLTGMIERSKKTLIIDSHLSHFIPKDFVKAAIITRCPDLKELEKRLKKRGYHQEKIRENLDCEIFDVCQAEAEEEGHNMIIVDTSKDIDFGEIIRNIDSFSD